MATTYDILGFSGTADVVNVNKLDSADWSGPKTDIKSDGTIVSIWNNVSINKSYKGTLSLEVRKGDDPADGRLYAKWRIDLPCTVTNTDSEIVDSDTASAVFWINVPNWLCNELQDIQELSEALFSMTFGAFTDVSDDPGVAHISYVLAGEIAGFAGA